MVMARVRCVSEPPVDEPRSFGTTTAALKDRIEYKDLGADHFARRDRSNAILRLVRQFNDLGCKVELTVETA
jgi:hypothetical protein